MTEEQGTGVIILLMVIVVILAMLGGEVEKVHKAIKGRETPHDKS